METAVAAARRSISGPSDVVHKPVPDHIVRPDYAKDGIPKMDPPPFPWMVTRNTEEEIACARVAGRISREVLDLAGAAVKPGVSTEEIDELVHEETIKRGAYPSPLNYRGFPKSVCTSIDEVVCHGIPTPERILKEGEMVNIDVSCYINGFHGDNSEMFCVGEVDEAGRRLIQVTYDAWQAAIAICKPGMEYNMIGGVIEDAVVAQGYTSVTNFCGHGVGRIFHTTPPILHYRNNKKLGTMDVGHIFTIEPMINEGTERNQMLSDGWTVLTSDGKRSAQFEHTLLITETGVEPLTGKLPTSPRYFWEK